MSVAPPTIPPRVTTPTSNRPAMTKQPEPISVDGPVSAHETAEVAAASSGFFSRHPSQIGPYKILRVIGRGGMGTVYRSQVVVSCEVPIGQEVALKLLRETDEKERKRFAREASYLQALRHPNIVRVLDNGEYEGSRWPRPMAASWA